MKSIYTTYKERLVEISGKSRSVYSKKGDTKFSIDLAKFFGDNKELFNEFILNIWNGSDKPFGLINPDTLHNLYYFNNTEEQLKKNARYIQLLAKDEVSATKYFSHIKAKEIQRLIESTVNDFTNLKKELLDIAKETGRYELYVGYPFVEGVIGRDTVVKAPLLLFPIKINIGDDSHASLELIKDMPVTLNKALLFAYAREKKVNIDDLNMEFGNNFSKQFKSINDVLSYLKSNHINIGAGSGGLTPFKESDNNESVHLSNNCVIGRYPLANSIYLDYSDLERRKAPANDTINEMIFAKSNDSKKNTSVRSLYNIHALDFTQEKALREINNEGNMVIYGPPGTGKSQTIVNVVSDALARRKRVLIVSQKKAALDVVYNRLGKIQDKALLISDPEHEKDSFYKRTFIAHKQRERVDLDSYYANHQTLQNRLNEEHEELKKIFAALYSPGKFGASLETMYEQSSQIAKNSYDNTIYEELLKRSDLLDIEYEELKAHLANIKLNDRNNHYYKYSLLKKNNPIVDYIKNDLDVYAIENATTKLDKLLNAKNLGYDTSRHDYSMFLVSSYVYNRYLTDADIEKLVTFIAKNEGKKGIFKASDFEANLTKEFKEALKEIDSMLNDYREFENILSVKGYQLFLSAVLYGNVTVIKNFKNILNKYSVIRDVKLELANLDEKENELLKFALSISDNESKFNQVIDDFMPVRMYIEIVKEEQAKQEELAKIMNFDNIRERILNLKSEQQAISEEIAANVFNNIYLDNFSKNKKSRDFLYQISKQQNGWPIRKFMNEYEDLMLDLYPCFLMSPETASTILPLHKDMFDLVIVDEASQVFIENTLPIMYRGKNLVVAGDDKQLKPTSTFMKRYSGSDVDEDIDPTMEAALEVESLLDLATSRLASANLNYHYRSKSQELIDFSNNYFYEGKLEIVPNIMGMSSNRAITRVMVNGSWIDRKNQEEASAVVELLRSLILNRENGESIGIIAFNSEQANAIEEEIRKQCKKDREFNELILKEQNRYEGNEDVSLFVKNLENVQGDERDIIILSVGYAPNENGRILANFGSLSVEGGENRLNVAISRAKAKTFVVTSIEPEDLKVSSTKNEGPKVLKNYLTYVRAVSDNKQEEIKICLNNKKASISGTLSEQEQVAKEIKARLEDAGYRVDVKVGNTNRKIDLAIFDEELDRYLLGIECINKDYKNIDQMIESQIYHNSFLESRGWNISHVWTRDWWKNKNKVINSLVREIEKEKKSILNISKPSKKTRKQ